MNILPQKYSDFKSKQYWNSFYSSLKNTQNEHFEWYGCYTDFKFKFHPSQESSSPMIGPKQEILHVGCGKSTFGEDLYKAFKIEEGYLLKITNCDYSPEIIDSMKSRLHKLQDIEISEEDKHNIKYEVCDLLNPFKQGQQYINSFDTIVDKGTLDALLPQDSQQNILKIKQCYFPNLQIALRKQSGKIVIISMLQQFILRTLLEHFYEEKNRIGNYTITIHECLIKDSKMQPFLIEICKSNNSADHILLKRFGTKEIQAINSKPKVLEAIFEIQTRNQYSHKIQSLIPGQRTKYKIFDQHKKNRVRYLIEVIDSPHKQALNKNNCAVFIVPQGAQTSYLYDDQKGIQELHDQIGTSRLLLSKLMPGNEFASIDQVKKQLNSVLPNLIQKKCEPEKVPYLMDAAELGQKNALYENKDLIIDEVIINGEPYRRLFKKPNISYVQSMFKIGYNGVNSIYSQFSKKVNSSILPQKKNLIIGIDKQELVDENGQNIFVGIKGFLTEHRLSKGIRVLIVGEELALCKYLLDNYETVEIVLATKIKSLREIAPIYLQTVPSERLEIFTMKNCISQYFVKNPQAKFDSIVMINNDVESAPQPQTQGFSEFVGQNIKGHLVEPGVFICNYWNYSDPNNRILLLKSLYSFFKPLYSFEKSAQEGESNLIFGLEFLTGEKDGKPLIHEELTKYTNRNLKNSKMDWQSQRFKQIKMAWPDIKEDISLETKQKFDDIYNIEINKPKKNKNKKKK